MSGTQTTFTDGKAYERLMGRWSGLVGRQFLEWLAVPPGMNWLDAGCGNGAFTEEIATHAAPAAIIGIDPAQSQIAYAIKRPGAKPAKFQLGDAQALPFANDSFDAAVTALVIAFIPDPAKAVAELSRVVRPGGWVASYMWDLPGGGLPLQPMYAAMRKMGLSPPLPPSFEFSRREAMQELWTKAGLEQVETTVITIPVAFSNFEDFWESCSIPVGPLAKLLQTMAPETREELKGLLRERLPVAPDGRIAYDSFANAVKGRKLLGH